jgi:hypothetical protein
MTGLCLLTGLCAAAGSAVGFQATADRHPSQAQLTAAGQHELATRWQRLNAGQIFPASVSYGTTLGAQTKATLIGIAPQAPCDSAVDAKAAAVLNTAGCVTVLRATYADASQTALATIGIVVLRNPPGGGLPLYTLAAGSGDGGLVPVSFPGTVASAFTEDARETYGAQTGSGPYVFLYAVGYSDGRSTTLEPITSDNNMGESVTTDLASGLMSALTKTFQAPANPCADTSVRC